MFGYQGGKKPPGERIAYLIESITQELGFPTDHYWEPFVGACGVIKHISGFNYRWGSDAHRELISLWKTLQEGWRPDAEPDPLEYVRMANDPTYGEPHMRAYTAHALSFKAAYFQKGRPSNLDGGRRAFNNLRNEHSIAMIQDVHFGVKDYREVSPEICFGRRTVIYCDPPYDNTSAPGCGYPFDNQEFWIWAETQSLNGHLVFIQELERNVRDRQNWQVVVSYTRSGTGNDKNSYQETIVIHNCHGPVEQRRFSQEEWKALSKSKTRTTKRKGAKRRRKAEPEEDDDVQMEQAVPIQEDPEEDDDVEMDKAVPIQGDDQEEDDDVDDDTDMEDWPGAARGLAEQEKAKRHEAELRLAAQQEENRRLQRALAKVRQQVRCTRSSYRDEAEFWRDMVVKAGLHRDVQQEQCPFCHSHRPVQFLDSCPQCSKLYCAECFAAWARVCSKNGAPATCPHCRYET